MVVLIVLAERGRGQRSPSQFPRYPTDAAGNRAGTPSLGRLEKLGLVKREAAPGYTIVTPGSRALELQRQFRDGWKAQAKGPEDDLGFVGK